ncbi:hypothetical protein ACA910_008036 [Epithemia clementina (nom. ined.)]
MIKAVSVTIAVLAVSSRLLWLYAPGLEWDISQQQQPILDDSGVIRRTASSPEQQQEQEQRVYNLTIPGADYILRGRLFLPNIHHKDENDKNNDDDKNDENDDDKEDAATSKSSSNKNKSNNNNNRPPPVVIMAHGLGLIQDFGLQPFIQAFLGMDLAVVTFDYPTFGASSGLPRHDIYPAQNYKYIQRIITYLQHQQQQQQSNQDQDHDMVPASVDATRVALWGTSLGGGHVLDCATQCFPRDGNDDGDGGGHQNPIKAVVANVPHVQSALETVLEMLWSDPMLYLPGLCRVVLAVLKQWAWQLVALVPLQQEKQQQQNQHKAWYLPITGPPGSCAILQNQGDEQGYTSLVRQSSINVIDDDNDDNDDNTNNYYWRNAATASSVLRLLAYRPLNNFSPSYNYNNLQQGPPPTLLVAAQDDTLCPLHAVQKAAQKLMSLSSPSPSSSHTTKQAHQLVILPNAGHFDVYRTGSEALTLALSITTKFLQQHILSDQAPETSSSTSTNRHRLIVEKKNKT